MRVVVEQLRLRAVREARQVDPQHRRTADVDLRADPLTDVGAYAELLGQLAGQRLTVALARVDLSAGELPPAGQAGRRGAPARQHAQRLAAQERRPHNLHRCAHGPQTRQVRTPLQPDELAAALSGLPLWSGSAARIARTVPAAGDALRARVAQAADELDHHPVVEDVPGGLRFVLWTHSCDGVTTLDIALAHRIDDLAGAADGVSVVPHPAG